MTDTAPADPPATPAMPPGPALQQRLHEAFERCREDALRPGGQLTEARLAEVERLARLAQLQDRLHPPRRRRGPAAALLLLTLMLLSLLLFFRVPATDIELDLVLSEAGFTLVQPQVLTDALPLQAIGAVGLARADLPRNAARGEVRLDTRGGARPAVQMELAGAGSSLTLEPLALPAGTRVQLRPTALPHQLRITLTGPNVTARAGLAGPIRIGAAGAPAQTADHPAPVSAELGGDGEAMMLDLTLPAGVALRFAGEMTIGSLVLDTVEQHLGAERSMVRRVSSIRSGALYFDALNGRERPLRADERLQLDGVQGQIRALRFVDDRIELSFEGRVANLQTGQDPRSLMPTWLEWLQAQHGLSLLWGGTLYVFGLLLAALRWWGWTP